MDKTRPRTTPTLALSELVGGVIAPVAARRGFAAADLVAAWSEIVGARYADCTLPEKITWPRGEANKDAQTAGVLQVRVDGPRAVLIQHELGQLVERINAFVGYSAITRIRLVQGKVARKSTHGASVPPEPAAVPDEPRIAAAVAEVGEGLRDALTRLGRSILVKPTDPTGQNR